MGAHLGVIMEDKYTEEYYQAGIENRLSCYENYSWKPERVYPVAVPLIERYMDKTFLDWGAAFGYLVKALRSLGHSAIGYEISQHCIDNCAEWDGEPLVLNHPTEADVVICKDVLEHVPHKELDEELKRIRSYCTESAVFVIPLGHNGSYRIHDMHNDVTHEIAENRFWWEKRLANAGFFVEEFRYDFHLMKIEWIKKSPEGHGFFFCEV